MPDAPHEHWMAAADILHYRHLAKQETSWLTDPADKAHILALGSAFTRLAISGVYAQPPELFHYTKLESFFHILRSACFRATNAQHCNDRNEVIHGRRRIDECIESQIRASLPRSTRLSFFRSLVAELIHRVRANYYVTCFASRERGRLEWGAYADGGKGVVIAVDTAQLSQTPNDIAKREVITLRPLVYEPVEQAGQLTAACELAYRTISRRLGAGKTFERHLPFVGSVSAMLCSHLTAQAVGFKDEFWADEREWRLVLPLYDPASDMSVVRTVNRREYVEITYPDGRLPITRVIVGPLCSADDELSVRHAMLANGYTVPVVRSDVPIQ